MDRIIPLPPMGTVAGEAVRATLVAGVFLLIFLAAELWRRRLSPPAEWTRKFTHVAAGAVVAGFPWLFASPWTVLALGALFGIFLWGTRRLGLLRSVHGIERRSGGDLYYLLAVCLLFLAGRGQPVFYLISILVLVLSDSLAALVGTTYGRWTFPVEAHRRSVEGSAVFFLTALLAVHLPLLMMTGIDRAASILVAVQLALIVTCFEAISLGGNDNLLVPLATYYLLLKMTRYPAAWIGSQLLCQLALLGMLLLVGWRCRLLTLSGAIAAHLFFYGALALCGPRWLVAPALALAGFVALQGRVRRANFPLSQFPHFLVGAGQPDRHYQVAAVFYVGIVAAALFIADNACRTFLSPLGWIGTGHLLYAPYVGALAGQLGVLVFLWLEPAWRRRRGRLLNLTLAAAGAGFAVVVPASFWAGPGGMRGASVAAAAAICLGGTALYCAGRQLGRWPKEAAWDLRLQAASVAAATVLALPFYLGWRP
jgi:dolichol kinase